MVDVKDKHKCCGCAACMQTCPKHCITMQPDNEGFLYPQVDHTQCIECGLCEKVCPYLHEAKTSKPLKVLAAINRDEPVRMSSSSGGIFTSLAQYVIQNGGVVFGARFDNRWDVIHDYTDKVDGLSAFRGSKYLQSRVGDTFILARRFLKEGRTVLFSGTSCQIAALRRFLQKDYDNLLTADLVCHGTPSPLVWRIYLEEIIARKGDKNSVSHPLTSDSKLNALSTIRSIQFRNKCYGWKKYSFALKLSKASAAGEQNTVLHSSIFTQDAYMQAFLDNVTLRPSCYCCPAKDGRSGADITLGDFWGIENVLPSFDDDKGTTLLLVNTDKGQEYINRLSIDTQEAPADSISRYNLSYYSPVAESVNRTFFFRMFRHFGFHKAWHLTISSNLLVRIFRKLYRYL